MQDEVGHASPSTGSPAKRGPLARLVLHFTFAYVVLLASPLVNPLVPWVGRTLLGLEHVVAQSTGSGDTTFAWVRLLLVFGLACIGGTIWTLVDRRPRTDILAGYALTLIVRYYLGATMVSYGFAKFFGQFRPVSLERLVTDYGASSPMGLLWTFMGHSAPYSAFTGVGELVGGLLLLWRRTTTLGALICVAILSNVVMLNFCYDVPVKIFSTHYLLMAMGCVALDRERLLDVFVRNRPTRARTWPELWTSRRAKTTRRALKLAFLGLLAAYIHNLSSLYERRAVPQTEVRGIYEVESLERDGVEVPPLLTDESRWRRLVFELDRAVFKHMDDSTTRFQIVSETPDTLVLRRTGESVDAAEQDEVTFHYRRPSADRLVLEGELDGQALRLVLERKDERDFLLTNRGFHWVNEAPLNR